MHAPNPNFFTWKHPRMEPDKKGMAARWQHRISLWHLAASYSRRIAYYYIGPLTRACVSYDVPIRLFQLRKVVHKEMLLDNHHLALYTSLDALPLSHTANSLSLPRMTSLSPTHGKIPQDAISYDASVDIARDSKKRIAASAAALSPLLLLSSFWSSCYRCGHGSGVERYVAAWVLEITQREQMDSSKNVLIECSSRRGRRF